MKTKTKLLIDVGLAMVFSAICVALVACGGGHPLHGWTGGLVGVWNPPPGVPVRDTPFILHQGHDCFNGCRYPGGSLVPVAEKLAEAGFVVYGFEMPPESEHQSGPLEKFTDPVIKFMDSMPGKTFYMAGLSGGGWTTTVVTAMDNRIIKGYSVSGDEPGMNLVGGADWEQRAITDYEALYAQAGSRLMHVFNRCDWIPSGNLWYPYVIDDVARTHQISTWATQYIIDDLSNTVIVAGN